jgi:hypothetical protein
MGWRFRPPRSDHDFTLASGVPSTTAYGHERTPSTLVATTAFGLKPDIAFAVADVSF